MTPTPITKSLIIPVYKNEANIPTLLEALAQLSKNIGNGFEVVFVVDGSPDNSYLLLNDELPNQQYPSQLISLSKNFGSFTAIRSGLESSRGKWFAVMAADLQEPPELIEKFFSILESESSDVLFGKRTNRKDSFLTALLSNVFWALYRKFVLPDIPSGGVDVFACNTKVRTALLQIKETNSSLLAQLFWVGFRRSFVPYERRSRLHGKSAWGLKRKISYMLDSIFSFSDLPIMLLLWMGVAGCAVSLILSISIFTLWLAGTIPVRGYTPIMLVLFFLGSLMLTSQGIIGCYVWRTSENSKRRPLSIVASSQKFNDTGLR